MSYMQNYVPSATAFSANQDDSAANSDAPTSFFYDAWAGSSSQAHAPTTPLHHHQQHTTTQTYATLAPYGSEEFYHTELVPDFAIITGPNLESHCNQPPTPLLDFLSLDMYKHLKPTCYHEPYVSNCKIESTQDWSALKAEIRAVFPNFDASSHLNLTKLMKQWEENFSTEPDFGVRHLHHTQLPLKPQSQLKHLLLRMSMGLARDVASKAFAFLDMVLARSVNAMPEFQTDLALACLLMATELINDEMSLTAPPQIDPSAKPANSDESAKPNESDKSANTDKSAKPPLPSNQPLEQSDKPLEQTNKPLEQSDKPDPKAEKTAYKDYLSIAAAAKARAGPNDIMSHQNRNKLIYVFASQWDWSFNCYSPLEWILLYLRNYAALTQGDETEFEEAGVPNLPEQTFYSAFYLLDGLMTHELAGHAPYSLLTAGIFKAVTVDLLPVNQRQIDASRKYTGYTDKELESVTEHIQQKFRHYMFATPIVPGNKLMDQGGYKIALTPILADAPYPPVPVGVLECPYGEEEMAAATVKLMESKAWRVDNWGGELFKVQPIPADAPYPPEPTGVIVGAWDAEEIAAATAKLVESDAWKEDDDWDLEMEGEEELNVERIPEDVPYPAEPTGMVVGLWEEAGFAAATARLLESKEWMEDEDWDMDAEEREYAAATAELLAEDWEDVEQGKEEEGEEDAVYLATAEFLAEDWDDGMEVDDWDEMDWEETDL
ncbi:hypothetical protein HDU77_007789 [Chytriomyces hyalinus]|nr:hypothetical protein HDU77_007789 [Chytriomyces hyalinus]